MKRRSFTGLLAVAAAFGMLAGPVAAQDKWPSKPVTVIVPFAAGGNTDVMARIFSEQLTKRLGQPFIVVNKAGAGGMIGLDALAKSAPNGDTIAVGTSGGLAINPILMKDQIPYKVETDFTYLYGMAAQPNIFLVHPSVPAKNMQELIVWLKANPDTPYATSGVGTSQHLCGEMLALAAGVKMTPIPYKGSTQSLQDMLGGQIKLACDNFAVAYEQVKSGKLIALSVTSPGVYPLAKELIPTSVSLPGFEMMPAFGWLAPANLPAEIAKTLIAELVAVGKLPEVRAAMEKFGVLQTELEGPAYAAAIKKERDGYATIIEKAGIKAQ